MSTHFNLSVVSAPPSRRSLAALQPGLLAAFIDRCFEKSFETPGADAVQRMAYPDFSVRALVPNEDSPRNPVYQPWLDGQREFLDALMTGREIPPCPSRIVFVLPERWLSPIETQQFMDMCAKRLKGKVNAVDVITMSSVILSDMFASMVRIVPRVPEFC